METHIDTNQIYLLMNEHTLSDFDKKEISIKFNNLINFINYLNNIKTADNKLKQDLSNFNTLLSIEQKATAKKIVSKNNLLSKNLIKSMTTQKENLLQIIEINQLHLEAELKRLNEKLTYPAIKAETSFFNRLFSLFKVPFKNKSHKKITNSIKDTREKINLTTSELSTLEKKKEDLSKEFGLTGTEALKYLNRVTYNSFLPVYDTSNSHLENLKNKITLLNN